MDSTVVNMDRIVVVSNRLPFTLKHARGGWRTERSVGGLATAMTPLLKQSRGVWIGWSGDASGSKDAARQKILDQWAESDGYIAVDLPPVVARRYYEGYANQTLWPLFHHFPSHVAFRPEEWEAYVEANQRFCEVVLKALGPRDLVWIHDYQLMLLPQMLRERAPEARIGFFLHIPFPSSAVFRILPRREELLQGLLGADYLAFHTYGYLQHLRASLLRILGIDSSMDRVEVGNRFVRLDALPIGIDPQGFTKLLDEDAATAERLAEIRRRFEGRRILLAVDRLDYTKGIPERLRTFRHLLHSAPDLRGKVVLMQVAVPSRERIPSYGKLRRDVDELVGKINGEFGTPDWTPVVYLRRGLPHRELTALYAAADLAWVAPLRDGLNLVAKEYVACKRGEDGALVLSEFAGAAAEMGEAFLVNPYDEERTAETIIRALSLPAEERRERMAALHRRVARNDVYKWSKRFLAGLKDATAHRGDLPPDQGQPLPVAEVVSAYQGAQRRLLILDYDGTLVPYANRPQDARPPESLIRLLSQLAADPANRMALLSGRPQRDLDMWFGRIEGVWLGAEHGAIFRSPETKEWTALRSHIPDDWKSRVQPVLEHFVDRTPGSFIEEKEVSLVWHYRMADPEFGGWLANEMVAILEDMLAGTELRAVHGARSIEVKLAWANKGEFVARLVETYPDTDFLFAIGDDRTDEDAFERLPHEAWTVHVGKKRSRARFRLPDDRAALALLERFAGRETGRPAQAFVSPAAK
ncbi:MAG TPA: bifunctional alpha,alpha-trehalose-phosphate synthase (UDP-forming)/trehalose-phosphatase [Blastocatellia bacterium]|nr:bifunctional alpha,alpha-trehalose-phosphate synthase (UDP-forming)/trehalose-phosphatase [Blastocatellia bacterium]